MAIQVVLLFVTLGLYSIYWYFVTLNELRKADTPDASSLITLIWTVVLVLSVLSTFGWFIAWWYFRVKYNTFLVRRTEITSLPKAAAMWFGVFFPPVLWFVVQRDLNRAAQQTLQAQ